jgi:hypothetical protein
MSDVVECFLKAAPTCVLARTVLEQLFDPQRCNELFERSAQQQYHRELLFSSVVEVMLRVVLGLKPSVHAAYMDLANKIPTSIQSVYSKLAHTDDAVSEALVCDSSMQIRPVMEALNAWLPEPIPGFRARVVDGNLLGKTERRINPLRNHWSRGLPGRALVVYEPASDLVTHAFLNRDAHACERTRMDDVLALVEPGDLWLADSHFCTHHILRTIHDRGAYFLIRHHSNMTGRLLGIRRKIGRTSTGVVYEQELQMRGPNEGWFIRRLTLVLDQPTTDGDTEIHVLTNVPASKADAVLLMEAYRQRWTIEKRFYDVWLMLNAEPKTLAYPAAALFAFCLGLVSSNAVALMRAALRSAHPHEQVAEMSNYHMALEIKENYPGMMIVWPQELAEERRACTAKELAERLRLIAARVYPEKYRKSKRGPKKPPPPKSPYQNGHTLSTQRLLKEQARAKKAP